jgi:hypothetical protein
MMAATVSFKSIFQLEDKPIFHYFPDHKDPADKQKGRHSLYGLQMHVGSRNEGSKTIAMYFPLTLEDALWSEKCKLIPSNILINDGENMIHFAHNFKYLGAITSDTLKKDLRSNKLES